MGVFKRFIEKFVAAVGWDEKVLDGEPIIEQGIDEVAATVLTYEGLRSKTLAKDPTIPNQTIWRLLMADTNCIKVSTGDDGNKCLNFGRRMEDGTFEALLATPLKHGRTTVMAMAGYRMAGCIVDLSMFSSGRGALTIGEDKYIW